MYETLLNKFGSYHTLTGTDSEPVEMTKGGDNSMKHRGTAALVVLAAMMFVPMTNASAEDTYADLPISEPPQGASSIDVAVYFADNMAFTPQWRLGNFIRIEIVVLDVTGLSNPSELDIEESNLYTQEELRLNPELLFDTNMVSVSEMWVNITSDSGKRVADWHSDFVTGEGDMTVIREINGEGHLIYGGRWDSSEVDKGGFYTVSVGLPSTYSVKWAVQHDRGVVEEPSEDVSLTSDDPVEEPPEAIGYMAVPGGRGGISADTNEAYIVLGELLDSSGSGANGGNGDGNSGGGNCHHGGKR